MLFHPVPGYEKYYSISINGEIYSKRKNEYLKPHKSKIGYLWVWLQGENRTDRKHFYVHRLVAETFIPKPITNEKLEVNHKDGDKTNPCLFNLEWITHRQNIKHAIDNGLITRFDKDNFFRDWINWTPEQLAKFEKSPYNIPACGDYEYPNDLKSKISQIEAEQIAA
jgi:hypothetical protein